MLKEERYEKILEMLEGEQYLSAQALSQRLFVSLPTIRRDLSELQMRKQIIRSHGGAKKTHSENIVAPLDFRKTVNASEKRALCCKAAELVQDNDVIFIDASTTTLQMAHFLGEKKNITVITNGIALATLLAKKGIKTYCTGGEIFENSMAHFGSFAEDFIRRFNIDILFFSCHGVNEMGMLTDPSLPETQIRRVAIGQAKKTVFLCDKTKFNLSTPYNLVPIQSLDCIITDAQDITARFPMGGSTDILIV
jgi:DeoR family fructose operon transcriptional repressor